MSQTAPASGPSALKGETRVEEPDRIGRAIARRSAEARATVPDLELTRDVDAGEALELCRRERCTLTAVLVGACATALRELPWANAAYRDGRYELYSRVNVGVVIETDGGPVVGTVLDADSRSPNRLTGELQRLFARARSGELTPPEQAGATFTLSDLSGHGAHRWSALVTPPQAAALTAGAVRDAPVVRGGAVVPGRLLGLTLGCDHRILFGARAGALMDRIAELVERPRP